MKRRVVTIFKSGSSCVIRLPKRLVEDWGLAPGMHLLIAWDRDRAQLLPVERDGQQKRREPQALR